jgi:hypothetical protein
VTPLPTTRVFPPAWSQRHRPTAVSAMTATVTVTRPGDGETYDPATGTTTPAAGTTLYEGDARIQGLTSRSAQAVIAAGQFTATRAWRVSLPVPGGSPAVGDLVHVDDCEDQSLTGRDLRVADITGGSLVWQVDMLCHANVRAGG